MLSWVLLFCVVHATTSAPLYGYSWANFQSWQSHYGRNYSSDVERNERFLIWQQSIHRINERNFRASFHSAPNRFSDLTTHEFAATFTNNRIHHFPKDQCSHIHTPPFTWQQLEALPEVVDWRDKGAITPVGDQGACGSCFAFSAIGAIESAWQIRTGKLLNLSVQQSLDCSWSQGNFGCQGGLMDQVFNWTVLNRGVCSTESYPYKARDLDCQRTCSPVARISGCVDLQLGGAKVNELAMRYVVATQQPISVAVFAGNSLWQDYSGGVIDSPECGPWDDHAVLLVGYTATYYIIKNSWSEDWGDEGYVFLARDKNMCGVAEYPSYPVVSL